MSEPKDSSSVEKLIVEYLPRLQSFIRKRIENKEDAEDILQDVFYHFIKAAGNAMNPIEHIAAWLYRVARNTMINHGVKKREEQLPVYFDDEVEDEMFKDFPDTLSGSELTSDSPESEYLRSLVWTELETALAELPPEQREIFELTELDGMSVKEISKTTNIPVNTLLSRKHYAVLHLRERLAELYADILA
ncbi:MAG: RNA polymerase sigma factor [Bacteroidales bacterium]|jgi:RNA polymerase sigma factor (sigma-70 family)|nr:RNA polymerase sigma factor [Bacteroidales bacterium]